MAMLPKQDRGGNESTGLVGQLDQSRSKKRGSGVRTAVAVAFEIGI